MNKALLLAAALAAYSGPLSAEEVKIAPVNGVWAADSTSDIGKTFGVKALEGTTIRGWVSSYYDYRAGNVQPPSQGVAQTQQNQSINGRVFDTRDQTFAVEMVKLETEKVPTADSRAGFKLDLGWGDAQDQIFAIIKAREGANADSATGSQLQHATVGYLFDIGSGLRFDMGKMVTHIGNEYADAPKNVNFSRDYIYAFAIPYNQTGIRLNYKISNNFSSELYLLNGWNTHFDNNKHKTISPSLQYTFGPVSGALNWMASLESDRGFSPNNNSNPKNGPGGSPDTGPGGCVYFAPGTAPTAAQTAAGIVACPLGSRSTLRNLFDMQVAYVQDGLVLQGAYDYATQSGIASPGAFVNPGTGASPLAGADGTRSVKWMGVALYAAYQFNEHHNPAFRWERYVDNNNFTTLQSQSVVVPPQVGVVGPLTVPSIATRFNSYTFTWNWKPSAHIILRPEFRYDRANRRTSLFLDAHGRPQAWSSTLSFNAVFYF